MSQLQRLPTDTDEQWEQKLLAYKKEAERRMEENDVSQNNQ